MKLHECLTIVIPVKNEEVNLPACLDNVQMFKHVVVVDSGSSDRTVEIAKKYNREVLNFCWNGEFPKKRNWVLKTYPFSTPWIMFLDADERITEAWTRDAERAMSRDNHSAYICYYDNWFMGQMLRHGDKMQKTAVLRVGAGGYERIAEHSWSCLDMEIHEHLQVNGTIGVIRAPLEHHDMRSLESYHVKHEEYANWEANRYLALTSGLDDGASMSSLSNRQRMKYRFVTKWWFAFAYFCACYFVKMGFLDGWPGLTFAWNKMKYFRNIRRKIAIAKKHG